MTPLTFEYSSVHGALAAAYTSGTLASEFGPEQVRVALTAEAEQRCWGDPLIAELTLPEAERRRYDTRLLGFVDDGDGPAWALLTSHVNLERNCPLLVRALTAVVAARPHRRPTLSDTARGHYPSWIAEEPLQAASILGIEDFVAGAAPLVAA